MEAEIKRVSEIYNKMPKFDWKEAENVGVSCCARVGRWRNLVLIAGSSTASTNLNGCILCVQEVVTHFI